MASKIVKKIYIYILDPYDGNDSILFDISKCMASGGGGSAGWGGGLRPPDPHFQQNQQNECAPSEDSDQPGHLPSLIRVFAVGSMRS